MSIVKLIGHRKVRDKILKHKSIPSSILLHGTKGIGKQRLALYLAQAILCENRVSGEKSVNPAGNSTISDGTGEPCNTCRNCKAAIRLQHPDIYWIFPTTRVKKTDPSADEVMQDYAGKIEERVANNGLYSAASGSEGIYVYTTKAIVAKAAYGAAMAQRKVFIVGDAERMVPQEGADEAANAFLKLLEEPPADTTIILTSSEPGSLLPTIKSRVVAYRCSTLSPDEIREFLSDDSTQIALDKVDLPKSIDDRVALAAGAPGNLIGADSLAASLKSARDILAAAQSRTADIYEIAMSQGVSGARGAFSDMLKALNIALKEQTIEAMKSGNTAKAFRATKGLKIVADAQAQAERNVNPQLVTAKLIRELARK